MHRNKGPVYYGDYLHLNGLLETQRPKSREYGDECHDEMLFIIVHQAYELWFKQIIHELTSVATIFKGEFVEEQEFYKVVKRLERIIKIQKVTQDHLGIIETMTPMDFLEFRDLLVPASGFQSAQFRQIEIMMGLSTNHRIDVDREYFLGRLNKGDRERLELMEKEPSIFTLLEKWLERVPFTQSENFDFWWEYQNSVGSMLKEEERIIQDNLATLSPEMQQSQSANLQMTKETFATLFDEVKYQELITSGRKRLSRKATLNALFILSYRDAPLLTGPYRFLTALMDIDENFTNWRYHHSLMVHRMLGTKIGTGGSSGHEYLKRAAENNQVFKDLFDLSTFLVPRSTLPELPAKIKKEIYLN